MKSLKYIAVMIACVTAIVLVSQLKGGCSNDVAPGTVVVPADSNYMPTTHESYKPPSLPFSKKKPTVKLPAGVKQSDVSRVITLETNEMHPRRIDITETKSGEIFVPRDSTIRSVTVTTFTPPVFAFNFRFGIGLSIGRSVSPAVVFSPIEWNGWLQAPILLADLEGLGLGIQASIYHEISLGAVALKPYNYDLDTMAKLELAYTF